MTIWFLYKYIFSGKKTQKITGKERLILFIKLMILWNYWKVASNALLQEQWSLYFSKFDSVVEII